MNRYRYITCGVATPKDKVSDFRLIAQNKVGFASQAFRIAIPDDMVLTKYDCDPYSITEDDRTLAQLHCVPVVKIKSVWRIMPRLADFLPCNWYLHLRELGYFGTTDSKIGYLPKQKFEQYCIRKYKE